MKKITRTIEKNIATVEVFDNVERVQKTITLEFDDRMSNDDIMKVLYKSHEKGDINIPLYVHDSKVIDYKYSMPLDKFMENATLENVSE